ncbi:MAG: hypothetical protein HYY76_12980 [Acidobacteria bacterium]|nr:hypothetical protein [Acidobacteriota bacterium]
MAVPGDARAAVRPRSRSARVAALLNEQIGSNTLTPYTVVKFAEDPRSAGDNAPLRRRIEQIVGHGWTIARVAAMSTDAIETQLRACGVDYSRERFVRAANGRTSAWSIGEEWLARRTNRSGRPDEDFFGLAACELWKRHLSDRPSVEMLDDRMQEGYTFVAQRRSAEACDIWWNVWTVLKPRFSPEMTVMAATDSVFSRMQSLFNWSQDFELELGNAALDDLRFAALGAEYCRQWLAQFRDEEAVLQVNFTRALASFYSRLGQTQECAATLDVLIEQWPDRPGAYIVLSDFRSHLFPGERVLPLDCGRAESYLRHALTLPDLTTDDRRIVEERLTDLQQRARATQPPG